MEPNSHEHKAVRSWVTGNDFAIVACSCGDQRGGKSHFTHLDEVGLYPDHAS